MNKRILFILLPLIAILVSLNCRSANTVFSKKGGQEVTVTSGSDQNFLPYSVKLKKNNNKELKNKIRIKAWDDNSIIEVPDPWILCSEAGYYHKPMYEACAVYFQSTHFSQHHLRGPPVDNI
jgi:hypothetical protein